jgi:hypothetical protein
VATADHPPAPQPQPGRPAADQLTKPRLKRADRPQEKT